jgi:hypothetical protein
MTDTFPPVKCQNHGEKEMYYVHKTHPAIIRKEDFDAVQMLLQRRAKLKNQLPDKLPFRGIIACGQCGTSFRKMDCHGKRFWSCRKHDRDLSACSINQIPDIEVKKSFLRLYHKLKHHGNKILSPVLTSFQTIRNRRMLWSLDVVELNNQISDLSSQNQMLTQLKKQGLIDPDIFIAQSNELAEQLRAAKLKKERVLDADGDTTVVRTQELMDVLETGPEILDAFDAELFHEIIEKIIVINNEQLRFRLKNGLELTETIERTVR